MEPNIWTWIYLGVGIIHWLVWSIWFDENRWLSRYYRQPGEGFFFFVLWVVLWPGYWIFCAVAFLLILVLRRPTLEKDA